MNISEIHPELQEVFKRIPRLPVHRRWGLYLTRLLLKLMPDKSDRSGVTLEDKKLGKASIRIYRPEGTHSGAALLWIHGGGLVMGTAAQDDQECYAYARKLNLTVISVEYRLAPEHPFPAAIDDCFEAWQWLQASAQDLGLDPSRMAIAGQSAGGGLAATLAQRIYDAGATQPAAQVLIYPMLDDRTATQKALDPINHLMWNNQSNRSGWGWYLDKPAGTPTIPPYAAAARRENLSGLPSTWIGVGDVDLFYTECGEYAQRLTDAGVNCQLHTVAQAPHAFERMVPRASISKTFYGEIHQFLRASLAL